MSFFTHQFQGVVDRHDYGKMVYHIVFVPEDTASTLPFDQHPRLRVSAEVNDFPVEGAFVPYGDGRYYLHLGKRLLKAVNIGLGDEIEVRFAIADQNAVDVPEKLQTALEENEEARLAWESLTPGKQRGFAYRVGSAKRQETQQKRVAEIFAELLGQ
ncbi:MAG: YdeI/OmpD-associated family protein [Henriciella sp.]|nr:YdeI/OmpD-associated family protein [Henriciella sp.]